jgi:hypothetical protein
MYHRARHAVTAPYISILTRSHMACCTSTHPYGRSLVLELHPRQHATTCCHCSFSKRSLPIRRVQRLKDRVSTRWSAIEKQSNENHLTGTFISHNTTAHSGVTTDKVPSFRTALTPLFTPHTSQLSLNTMLQACRPHAAQTLHFSCIV